MLPPPPPLPLSATAWTAGVAAAIIGTAAPAADPAAKKIAAQVATILFLPIDLFLSMLLAKGFSSKETISIPGV
jgi:hypothetical protein